MKLNRILLSGFLVILLISCQKKEKTIQDIVNDNLEFSTIRYLKLFDLTKDSLTLPKSQDSTGKLFMIPSSEWTSGFVPGTLWYLYENSMDTVIRSAANKYTHRLEKEQYNKSTHDLGFMLYCSYGNGYRLTADTSYKRILLTGAKSLLSRFRPKVGCIQSWGSGDKWQCPVIIDNMMNLEYLMWAFKASDDSAFLKVAISHADNTIKNHFRPDYSSYHLVNYDTITGKVIGKQTVQGASDSSAWARGQAWGLYGYTMMYRETKLTRYLDQAKGIANFILKNPHFPKDKIPYWDFNASGIPNELRDASAGAIICSALIELSQFVEPELSAEYQKVAEIQIKSLSSPAYRFDADNRNCFILKHSIGSKPANSEVDIPLNYADYYYVEALIRFKDLLSRNTQN